MTLRPVSMSLFAMLVFALAGIRTADAVDNIQVGDVITDSPTICCLGFSVPVSGDDNYDAVAAIEYRLAGTSTWSQGLPLLRVGL